MTQPNRRARASSSARAATCRTSARRWWTCRASEFDALPVPEDLRDAIIAARRITSHGARVRQRLYIGKLLRNIDPEPIREALASRAEVDRQRVRREHAIEAWRDRLLADEPAAWTELAALIGTDNLPQLRSLVRQARAERDAARAPSAARQLFRRLRELLSDGRRLGRDAAGATMPR